MLNINTLSIRFKKSITNYHRMESWRDLLNEENFSGCRIRESTVPAIYPDDRIMCLEKCKENLCGCYGTNWGCPPGFIADDDLSGYDSAILVSREFQFEHDRDPSGIMSEMQKTVRDITLTLRRNKIECYGIADGGCGYCGICAYPEPCRFPDMLIPSISALGIDIGRYLRENGEEFSFTDGKATMYGIILLKNI